MSHESSRQVTQDPTFDNIISTLPSPSINQSNELESAISFLMRECSCNMKTSLLLINIRSLIPKLQSLRIISVIVKPCFICVTETWLTESVNDSTIALPGYDIFRTDRTSKLGGGCIIYSRTDMCASILDDPPEGGFQESVWIYTKHTKHPMMVGCIYLPPQTHNHVCFLTNLFTNISTLPFSQKIIVGDFNLPEVNWNSPCGPPRYASMLAQLNHDGWVQNTQQPTRSSSILDLVFTNGNLQITTAVGPVFPGSDHNIVVCTIRGVEHTSQTAMRVYHKFTPSILSSFASLVRSADWTELFLSNDTQRSTDLFYEALLGILLSVSPPIRLHSQYKYSDKVTLKLMRSLSKTRKQYNTTKCFGLLLSINRTVAKLNSWRHQCEVQQEQICLKQPSNPRLLSQLMRSRYPRDPENITTLKLADGTLTNNSIIICETFNSFFASCYSLPFEPEPSSSRLPHPLTCHPISPNDAPALLDMIHISLQDVSTQLRALKASSVPGPDGLPSIPLIQGGNDLPLLLHHLFVSSMKQGLFPLQWKQSVVTPRYKSGPRTAADSYRGIHHTSLISRIFERTIKSPLTKHLVFHNLISDRQYGFLLRRSTTSCQTDFFDLLSSAHEAGSSIIIVYLDIKKAFDRVPHAALLRSLAKAGISGSLLQWFASYLSGRVQVTRISGFTSGPAPITSGVVQGSVLGPILFLLHINSALAHITHGEPFLFADDIKIVYKFPIKDTVTATNAVQTDLNSLTMWSSYSGLEFSTDKSLLLTYRCPSFPPTIKLGNSAIRVASETRDLGVRYSCTFNFTQQAQYQIAKARKMCYYILRSFNLPLVKLALYKQRILPILEYCPIVFQHYSQQDRHNVERIQRFFTRKLLPTDCTLNYRQRCEYFKLDPLWMRRLKLNLRFLHRLIHSQAHTSNARLTLISSDRHIRNSDYKVKCDTARSSFRHNFFLSFYSRLWNKLPETIRSLGNNRLFSNSLNDILSLPKVQELFTAQLSTDALCEVGPRNV